MRDSITRSAIVHDFFVADGGAERCAFEFARLLPDASLYTSFFDAARFSERVDPSRVRTWPLQRWPRLTRHFRHLYPLYAAYFGSLKVRDVDLVISSSIAFAKAVQVPGDAVHVSYVYTPMRYAWDLDSYLSGSSYPLLARGAARAVQPILRQWDRRTAKRPQHIVAISNEVARRISERWGREAESVIYPPVDVSELRVSAASRDEYIIVARLLAYRRIDLAIQACNLLGRRLVIIGEGPERARLEAMAGPTIEFAGYVPRREVLERVEASAGYLMPGVEDFGIAPIEAMAAGKAVVAYAGGGALETVKDGVTGVLFGQQTVASLVDAIERFEAQSFDAAVIRRHAERFDVSVFRTEWRNLLERLGMATTH